MPRLSPERMKLKRQADAAISHGRETLFHGTNHEFKPGDIIDAQHSRPAVARLHEGKNYAFASTDPGEATFAGRVGSGGHVYRVVPAGKYEFDPHQGSATSRRTTGGFRVVSEVQQWSGKAMSHTHANSPLDVIELFNPFHAPTGQFTTSSGAGQAQGKQPGAGKGMAGKTAGSRARLVQRAKLQKRASAIHGQILALLAMLPQHHTASRKSATPRKKGATATSAKAAAAGKAASSKAKRASSTTAHKTMSVATIHAKINALRAELAAIRAQIKAL
jgi:hypothetical protein